MKDGSLIVEIDVRWYRQQGDPRGFGYDCDHNIYRTDKHGEVIWQIQRSDDSDPPGPVRGKDPFTHVKILQDGVLECCTGLGHYYLVNFDTGFGAYKGFVRL